MYEFDHRATTERWIREVWNERREATIDELVDPSVIGYLEGVGFGRLEDFKAGWRELLATFPQLHCHIEDMIIDGDNLVFRWLVNATHGDSGKLVEFRGLTWLTFRNGKILRGWDAWNQGGLIAQLQAAAT